MSTSKSSCFGVPLTESSKRLNSIEYDGVSIHQVKLSATTTTDGAAFTLNGSAFSLPARAIVLGAVVVVTSTVSGNYHLGVTGSTSMIASTVSKKAVNDTVVIKKDGAVTNFDTAKAVIATGSAGALTTGALTMYLEYAVPCAA